MDLRGGLVNCRRRLKRERAFRVLVEKIENRLVGANLVRLLREAVAFVVEDDVFDHAVLLDRVHDLIGLRLDDARIIRALQDDEAW